MVNGEWLMVNEMISGQRNFTLNALRFTLNVPSAAAARAKVLTHQPQTIGGFITVPKACQTFSDLILGHLAGAGDAFDLPIFVIFFTPLERANDLIAYSQD